MTVEITGATSISHVCWKTIDWSTARREVYRLQVRIAKAFREGRHSKAKALQWILTHSFYARALAIKRVTQNKGAKTPGIDNVIWKTSKQKEQAILTLKRRGYSPQPLRRIYIAKRQKGKFRPLSIPTMSCRAQQALHLLALEPIAETIADNNAYGFRPLRSTADAIEQCFNILSSRYSATYILEGDIKSCFDTISHEWILQHTLMDKQILKKWLEAGYLEKDIYFPVKEGTPQGSLISPTLLNITLAGLEDAVHKAAPKQSDRVNVCVYADDFIISCKTKAVLENQIKPAVENFLSKRGLKLSLEKTTITHIDKGFDFLGMNLRKYKGKLIIQPAKSSVHRFLTDLKKLIKFNATEKTETLIHILNPKIRGWVNYYRHVCSKKTFSSVDHVIFKMLWKWSSRRHPSKPKRWIKLKYFQSVGSRNWVFKTKVRNKKGNIADVELVEASSVPIKRHTKIRSEVSPYNPSHREYINQRKIYLRQNNINWKTFKEKKLKQAEKLG